jgi:predicted RNase H-like HicB family nuclease
MNPKHTKPASNVLRSEERSNPAVPHKAANQMIKIPVLCKFWHEDGVWNGAAQDLAIAVFGYTFEEAQKNLSDAIFCHLEALQELNKIEHTIEYLKQRARDFNVSVEEIPSNRPIMRMDATFFDNQVAMTV